jgi:cell division septum initiation protein DivIVA
LAPFRRAHPGSYVKAVLAAAVGAQLQCWTGGSTISVVRDNQQTTLHSTSDWDELRGRIDELERELERYREHEQLVVKTLLSATTHATAIRESARREAELTLRKARAEAEKRKTGAERERDDARNELLRLRRITEQMRRGLSAFLTAKVEELRLEIDEEVPSSGQDQELEAALGSALEGQTARAAEAGPEPASHPWAEIRDGGGHGSSSGSPDGLP